MKRIIFLFCMASFLNACQKDEASCWTISISALGYTEVRTMWATEAEVQAEVETIKAKAGNRADIETIVEYHATDKEESDCKQ